MATSRLHRNVASRYSKHPKDPKEQFKRRGNDLIRKVSDKDRYGIFLDPVDTNVVEGYLDVITRPMDLTTLSRNLNLGVYRTPAELYSDLELIWSNCCTFNPCSTIFFREAVRLRALSARFYDDLLLLLERDGVADALGITSQAHSQSTSVARPALNRPPRYPPAPPRTSANAAGTLSATNASADANTVQATEHASSTAPSANAVLAPTSGVAARRAQLQQAQLDRDAAFEALQLAKTDLKNTARKAGLPCDDQADHDERDENVSKPTQLFQGPAGILRDSQDGRPIVENPDKFPLMRSHHMTLRCSEIPLAWRRVGRWHPPGSTSTPVLSAERAHDVFYGKKFESYVQKSAPIARRLLATVLDPDVVEAHDDELLARANQSCGSSTVADPTGKNGRVNGIRSDNNSLDRDAELQVQPDIASGSRKRPRRTNERGNGKVEVFREESDAGRFLTEVVGSERVRKAVRMNEPAPAISETTPNKQALSRMRSLLKSKGIDSSFVNELLVDEESQNAPQYDADANGLGANGTDLLTNAQLVQLLNGNYEAMVNGLRLRNLRDSVTEAEREEVEDRERECAETAAKGVALAVKQLPPRFVVHPLDAAECAKAICNTMPVVTSSHKS